MTKENRTRLMAALLVELLAETDPPEASPPQAGHVQSVVGAAGCGIKQGESGVGASRQTLAKLRTLISDAFKDLRLMVQHGSVTCEQISYSENTILHHLKAIEAAAKEQDVL